MSSAVDEQREQIARSLGDPDRLAFPAGWSTSTSWRRAQEERSTVAPRNPADWIVQIGDGARHTTMLTIVGGDVRAECDCMAHRFQTPFCAHVALLWRRWTLGNLGVTDLDTGRTHLRPPAWIRVDDEEAVDDA